MRFQQSAPLGLAGRAVEGSLLDVQELRGSGSLLISIPCSAWGRGGLPRKDQQVLGPCPAVVPRSPSAASAFLGPSQWDWPGCLASPGACCAATAPLGALTLTCSYFPTPSADAGRMALRGRMSLLPAQARSLCGQHGAKDHPPETPGPHPHPQGLSTEIA